MSEIAKQVPQALVLPHTGELIDLADTQSVAVALDSIRAHEQQLREIKGYLTDALVQEASRQGTKTLHLDWLDVEIGGGEEVSWDIEQLHKLQDAGLPADRFDALVRMKVEYRVSAQEAKRISALNKEYAHIIENARTIHDAPYRASIRRRK